MFHTLARAAALGLIAGGVILGAAGVASADSLVGIGDRDDRRNDRSIFTPELQIVSPVPAGGESADITPWQEFCLMNVSAEEYANCEAGLP